MSRLTSLSVKDSQHQLYRDVTFCERFVEKIYPRTKMVEMDAGSIVLILRKPEARPPKTVLLPKELGYHKSGRRMSPKIRVVEKTCISPRKQMLVTLTTKRCGIICIQPSQNSSDRHGV